MCDWNFVYVELIGAERCLYVVFDKHVELWNKTKLLRQKLESTNDRGVVVCCESEAVVVCASGRLWFE
jgi:hypothetical protein